MRIAAALATALLAASATAASATDLRVRGNELVDGTRVVRLLGVNRSGLEQAGYGGAPYRRIVARYVAALRHVGLYVILDLHWAGAGRAARAVGQIPMADAARAPAFWRSVARVFEGDHGLVFDLFNEPYGISWQCWLRGCLVPAGGGLPAYRAAGMQALVDAVRSVGARQPLMLGGLGYAGDLSGWRAHEPHDPLGQLVASEHNYGVLSPCSASCLGAMLAVHRRVPVVFGELGETDCAHGYIDSIMRFADAHGISYLGWAWDATNDGWSCTGGPSLITSYDGTPTAFGVGLRDHLRALAAPAITFVRSPGPAPKIGQTRPTAGEFGR